MDSQEIVKSFLNSYYQTMMTNRPGLINFYTESSCFSYERSEHKGLQSINEKLAGFSFKSINYNFDEFDVQPAPIEGGLVIMVVGELQLDGSDNFRFSQVFQLLPNGNGGYYLHNDIFRLIQ